jgi:hypothetical protein
VSESPNRSCGPSSGQQITFPSSLQTTVDSIAAPKTAGTVKKEIPLKSDYTYYWWLKVYGPNDIPGGCAYGGKRIRFKTSEPKATLVSPPDAPAEGSKVSPFQVTLKWNEVKGAAGYVLQWGKAGVAARPAGEPVDSTSADVEPGAVGTYFWRVIPKGPLSGDMGAVSSTWKFVADIDVTKPKLIHPDGTEWQTYGEATGFGWELVPGATGYLLTIGRNANQAVGENPVEIDSGFTLGPTIANIWVNDVSTHKEGYCWTVKAAGPGNFVGVSSDVWCYRIGAATPVITSPQSGAQDVEYDPFVLSWTCAYCPGGFQLTYSTPTQNEICSTFSSETVSSTVTSVTRYNLLSPDKIYCAQVDGLNPDSTYHYGPYVEFRTKPESPEPPPPGVPAPVSFSTKGQGIGVVFFGFMPVAGATKYRADVYLSSCANVTKEIASLYQGLEYPDDQGQLAGKSAYLRTILEANGWSIPEGAYLFQTPIAVVPQNAYMGHLRACNAGGCGPDGKQFYQWCQ